MAAVVLDGRSLAARRAPLIAAQAAAVREQRGRAPRLLLVAFADRDGHVPHVNGKLRACEGTRIEAVPLIIEPGSSSAAAAERLRAALTEHRPDAVFVQIPFPDGMDGDVVAAAIPAESDVDVMTPDRRRRYMTTAGEPPPLTVTAALLLLDEYGVSVEGRHGVVIAEPSPFAAMFAEALRRRGAVLGPPVRPDGEELDGIVGVAELVVVAAGRAGALRSDTLKPGSIVLDVGYFNPGGRGDIDVSTGTAHLGAFMPVPGGIGPMTVSALLERVVELAGR